MNSKHDQGSSLFMVRLWSGEGEHSEDHKEWHGRVQHVISGEARTFSDLSTLMALLLEMVETEGIQTRAQGARIQEVIP